MCTASHTLGRVEWGPRCDSCSTAARSVALEQLQISVSCDLALPHARTHARTNACTHDRRMFAAPAHTHASRSCKNARAPSQACPRPWKRAAHAAAPTQERALTYRRRRPQRRRGRSQLVSLAPAQLWSGRRAYMDGRARCRPQRRCPSQTQV
eukprot:5474772-Pleurochrysis_carterae.AAC.2